MVNSLEWDNILPLAAADYNWFPNEHSKEPAFFLMFRWDVVTHFAELVKPKWRYLGDIKGLLKNEQLRKLYQITAYNLLKAREHYIKDQIQKHIPQPQLNIGDAVLVRDQAREQFRPRYKDYWVTKRLGNARVEVCDNHGKLSVRHVSDVKQVTPLECTVQLIPETTGMGHKCTLTVNPDRITDLQWQATDRTLLDNLTEIAGKASKISEITSTQLWELCCRWQHRKYSIASPEYPFMDNHLCKYMYIYVTMSGIESFNIFAHLLLLLSNIVYSVHIMYIQNLI